MYDECSLVDMYLDTYGSEVVTVSEADSYFPDSLTLYKDVVSAYIVAEDEDGPFAITRPEEYEIESDTDGKTYIHAPYNIIIKNGDSIILKNPPRFLRVVLKGGEKHYFPFGDDGTKVEYSQEVAELFRKENKDIKILRKAAEAMKELEGLDEDFFDNDIETDEIYKRFPNAEISEFLKKNKEEYEDDDRDEDDDDDREDDDWDDDDDWDYEEYDNGMKLFLEAVEKAGEYNKECYSDRMQEFFRLTEDKEE